MKTFFPNIVSDPRSLGGKPCVRGTRISIDIILEWLSSGGTIESIAREHSLLTPALVSEAVRYVAHFFHLKY